MPPPLVSVKSAVMFARQAVPMVKLGVRRATGQKSPFQMTLSLTNRCNFKCEYCDIPLQKRDELSVDEWCAAIDELRAGGMGRVSLIGGEPLIFDGIERVVAHLKSRGIHTAMNSNGWLVPEKLDVVRQLDLICLTVDGPRDVHDRQRKKGSYDKVLEAIAAVKRVGTPLVSMTVLTPSGVSNVEHVLELAEAHGFTAFFQLEHDKGCDVMAPIAPRLDDSTVQGVADRLLSYKKAGRPVGNSTALLEAQRSQRYLGSCKDCHAGTYYGYVLSDGTVAPCLLTQWQQQKGNGRTYGFLEAFHRMSAPVGPGCSCVPTHEVNRVLDLNPRALIHAVEVMLGLAA